ncbi:hypothetical protein I305_02373 [Cryptococcus gattii E566]|uniref:Uncharacterized protein n=2 Tax=Cryptococcus gattii TaxID=37769 RepID=E6RBF8_CRYGW|nr:Hypothetical protein CGB_H5580W [Cryptococcus gattii WM276]ADV24128.1 Hypothetical protein CGB_H5580W [Cryptococcus gattii WM276]KIR81192.1 hypothetical protein I306_01735 [Cryptococcus gattii EJB2]KIY34814.1 hypothetical protein I305_02373 [Cryptococcus gattii E566]
MKYKDSNPFQRYLYITNLPSGLLPAHLSQILAHPPKPNGKRSRKRDTGVKLIQVYTVPRKSKRRILPKSKSAPPSNLSDPKNSHHPRTVGRLTSLFSTILCLPQGPDLGPLHPSTSTENQGSPKSHLPIASPLSSDIGDRNGTETEVVIERGVGEEGLDGEKSGQVSQVDEDMVDQKLEGDAEETCTSVIVSFVNLR